jgi:hypothetical protein
MKSGKYLLVLLMSILLTTAIACGSGTAEPTPTPTAIPTPTPTAIPVLPDLTITNLTFDPTTGCAGAPVRVAVTIQNKGTLVSPACYWSWQLFAGSVTLLNTLPSLPPGGTTIVHTEMTLADDITGTFNTTAIVDPTSVVAELNESDNQFTQLLTVSICNFQSNYDSDKSNIQTALSAYMASHNGSIPYTNNSVQLNYPAGTYHIINICALLGAGDLLDTVPASCIDSSFDNCDNNGCNCQQNAHYIWLSFANASVVSACIGGDCEANSYDGYQGIWP